MPLLTTKNKRVTSGLLGTAVRLQATVWYEYLHTCTQKKIPYGLALPHPPPKRNNRKEEQEE